MEKETKTAEIHFYYEKNPLYREIYVDGLIGGKNPSNMINMNFYATRRTIPKSSTHQISDEGKVSSKGKISDDSKNGIIREIEFGIYITKDTAKTMFKFLKEILGEDVQP